MSSNSPADSPANPKSTEDKRSQWNAAKFLATLGHFGEIPFVGSFRWIQKLVGQSPTVPGINLSQCQQKVLVVITGSNQFSGQLAAQAQLPEAHPEVHKSDASTCDTEAIARALQRRLADSVEVVFDSFTVGKSALSSRVRAVDTVVVLWGDRASDNRDDTSHENPFVQVETIIEALSKTIESADFFGESAVGNNLPACIGQTVERTVFDFTSKACDLSAWGALDDVVMGGVSEGSFFLRQPAAAEQDSQVAVFAGQISTANSGGFSSVRTRNFEPPFDFDGWSGIRLRLQGDGQRYKFIARNSDGWDSPAYIYSFDTVDGKPTVVDIPFEALVATFRAKSVSDAPAFNPKAVFSFQLMLSKFEYDRQLNPSFSPGPFELIVSEMSVYRSRRAVPLVVVNSTNKEERDKQHSALMALVSKAKVDYRLVEPDEGDAEGDVIEAIAQAIMT